MHPAQQMNPKAKPRSSARRAPQAQPTRLGRLSQMVWLGVGVSLFAWLFEVLLPAEKLTWNESSARTLSASLFFSLCAGLCLGLVLAGLWLGSFGTSSPGSVLAAARQHWQKLRHERAARRASFIASVYAGSGVLGAGLLGSFHAARTLVVTIARPNNVAVCIVAAFATIVLACLGLFVPVQRSLHSAFTRLARGQESSRIIDVRPHLWGLAALITVALAWLSWVFWLPLTHLPWRSGSILVLASAVSGVTSSALGRVPRRVRRGLALAVALAFAAVGALGANVQPSARPGLDRIVASMPLAELGYTGIVYMLDWDGDGHLSCFGDSDCAPFDPSVHPGAVERIGNGIDEDCDGADLSAQPSSDARGRTRYPLPESWPEHPDIYLITIDTFATDTLLSLGGSGAGAVHLDELARSSALFERHFAQGPSTRLSLPSLFSSRYDTQIDRVLTGRFPFELAASNVMLAEVLRDAGYFTAAVLPNSYFLPEHWAGLTQGFSSVDGRPALAYSAKTPHTAEHVTDRALKLVRSKRNRPLFLWAHYFDAHPPHSAPPHPRPRSEAEVDLYKAEVAYVDENVHELVEAIRRTRQAYVIVITGDHGIAFDSPRHAQEHYAYDLSTLVLHVPLFVVARGWPPRRIDTLTSALDVAPTIVNLARIRRSLPFEGHSLVPLLLGKNPELPPVRFAEMYISEDVLRGEDPFRLVSARSARFNLVLNRRTGTVEAWDFLNDPEERHDLWPVSRQRGELGSLKTALDRFVTKTYRGAGPSMAAPKVSD